MDQKWKMKNSPSSSEGEELIKNETISFSISRQDSI